MANCWTDEYAIWQDLSIAQGRAVPVEIDTVAQNKPPPIVYINEETEEAFLSPYVGGEDINCGPDLDMISQMLREVNRPTDDSCIQESSLSLARTEESSPSLAHTEDSSPSLVHAAEPSPSLARTEDSTSPIFVDGPSIHMFTSKKKNKPLETSPTHVSQTTSDTEADRVSKFVPSEHASDLYKRYSERSRAVERAREDLWSRVERQMKEIDDKRRQQAAETSVSEQRDSTAHGMDLVRLAAHRHMYVEAKNCVVCQLISNKYKLSQLSSSSSSSSSNSSSSSH